MYLCFYRGRGFFAAIVRWWSGPWAHCEFQFSNGIHWGIRNGIKSGFYQGTTPDFILEIPLEECEENLLRGWCTQESGCDYDWKGILLAQVFNRSRSSSDKWFCSEVCVAGLQVIGELPTWLIPCTVSPSELARIWQIELEEACFDN